MQDNIYGYAVFWYEWIVEEQWRVNVDGEEEEDDY